MIDDEKEAGCDAELNLGSKQTRKIEYLMWTQNTPYFLCRL
jgi:hypothetical protein